MNPRDQLVAMLLEEEMAGNDPRERQMNYVPGVTDFADAVMQAPSSFWRGAYGMLPYGDQLPGYDTLARPPSTFAGAEIAQGPQTATGRVVSKAMEGVAPAVASAGAMAATGGMAGLGSAPAANLASGAVPYLRDQIWRQLIGSPATAMIAGAGAGAGSEGTGQAVEELGGGPMAQSVGRVAGGLGGGSLAARAVPDGGRGVADWSPLARKHEMLSRMADDKAQQFGMEARDRATAGIRGAMEGPPKALPYDRNALARALMDGQVGEFSARDPRAIPRDLVERVVRPGESTVARAVQGSAKAADQRQFRDARSAMDKPGPTETLISRAGQADDILQEVAKRTGYQPNVLRNFFTSDELSSMMRKGMSVDDVVDAMAARGLDIRGMKGPTPLRGRYPPGHKKAGQTTSNDDTPNIVKDFEKAVPRNRKMQDLMRHRNRRDGYLDDDDN